VTIDPSVFVHDSAIVELGAAVGAGTKIWHYAHVRDGATIGRDCTLGKNVFVDAGAALGDGVRVQNNVSVYRGVTLAEGVLVGPSAVFTNDRYPRAHGHDWEVAATSVGAGAAIGANATIVCGLEIGEWATVAAGAVVTRSVEAWQLVMGNPARPAGWCCWCGRVVSRDTARPGAGTVCACGLEFGTVRG
jgi:UDP-2-acetamido-3-amino-2,3-dideoxy-glucuronate N-acetyltransferase